MTGPLKKLKEKIAHTGDKEEDDEEDEEQSYHDAVDGDAQHEANVAGSDDIDTPPDFRLRVTAGPDYDKSTQKLVRVNGQSTRVSDEVRLAVRIKDYSGFPEGSPSSSQCFESSGVHAKDTFSIAFAITPREDIKTEHLYFGLDTGETPLHSI
jgi:hypothetical protein